MGKKSYYIIFIIILIIVLSSGKKESSKQPINDYTYKRISILTQSDLDSLNNIYALYETTIKNNDQAGFINLFNEPFSPLYNLVVGNNKPFAFFNTVTSWASNLSNDDYFVIIDTVFIEGFNNVSLVKTKFHSNWQYFGQHLNLHIKTDKGWKIVCMNLTDKDNQIRDYLKPSPIKGTIPELINKFTDAFNNKLLATQKSSLFESSGMIYNIETDTSYFSSLYLKQNSLSTFADSMQTIVTDTNQLTFNNIDIKIVDIYLAQMIADYQITSGESIIEEGLQVWTMVASSKSTGWKITSMVWQKE